MIIYEKILSPRSYVEIITGNYYIINDENQYQETKEILRQIGCNKLCDYSLANVKKVDSPRKKFVLVEFLIEGENDELDYECRWCEVPENVTTERIIEVA